MKFSYTWISQMIDGLATDPRELTRLITMKTAESEGVEHVGELLAGACPATVVSAERVGKKNQKAVVETDKYGVKTLVCGAPNCRPGLRTIYVPLGVKTIDGVESDGMLASGAELGINSDDGGIVELGASASIASLTPDTIIEIDNKSLTHRPDLWGHHGMAREVAAITGRPLLDPANLAVLDDAKGPSPIKVEIEDFALCPRYSALVFDHVKVGPSPLWLQYLLHSVGLNSINNIVDVTNYIAAEIAQPTHAFDRAKLAGDTIVVRPAKPAESFKALNGEAYSLDPANLVIADASGAVAVAGVTGGLDSGVSATTTSIVFESANFFASSVRKTSSKLKLRTDASIRFEKAQDPANTLRGLARAVVMLRLVCPGITIVGGVVDVAKLPAPATPIELPLAWLQRKLGRAIEKTEVAKILTSLEFGVTDRGDSLSVTVPSWRATKDVSIKDDLVEEVGRVIGYASITPTPPELPVRVPPANPERAYHRRVRIAAAAQGFTEVYNYSFINEAQLKPFGFDAAVHVAVANPIASDQDLLRASLLPNIVRNISDNLRHFETFRLFEIGNEIHKGADGELPAEIPHLTAVACSKHDTLIFDLKRLAECLMPGCTVHPAPPRVYEHPARAAEVRWRGEVVGRLFEFHPSVVEARAAALDVDLAKMHALEPAARRYEALRRFPVSAFDLSVVTAPRELTGVLESHLRELAATDLVSLEYLRTFSGAPLPDHTKSVSFRLTIGAGDRTLNSDEMTAIRTRIMDGMRARGYDLRA